MRIYYQALRSLRAARFGELRTLRYARFGCWCLRIVHAFTIMFTYCNIFKKNYVSWPTGKSPYKH
jgi:hypothetical protein